MHRTPDDGQNEPEQNIRADHLSWRHLRIIQQKHRAEGTSPRRGETGGFAEAFGDIFGDIFGQGGRPGAGGRRQVYRGADLSYAMEVTLEEAANNTPRSKVTSPVFSLRTTERSASIPITSPGTAPMSKRRT